MHSFLGWDIGGVNTKAALVVDGLPRRVMTRAFELQRAPETLTALLVDVASAIGATHVDAHAVTMTAELSQMFRTKRDGVSFVLDAVESAFPGAPVHVYTTDGSFVAPAAARAQPLAVAAANWVATAHVVARQHPDALLVDVGTTTTDLIPIVGGTVAASGRNDPERLASGELVYTGAVRTPVEAIVRDVPMGNGRARVAAEAFALSGDVHVWLGDLAPGDYDAATPDGRPPERRFAGERLARVVCADREMLDDEAITAIAATAASAQVASIATAMREVLQRHPSIATAVVTGLGAFVAARAAVASELRVTPLSEHLGADGARSAPATAVALLLHERLSGIASLTRSAQLRGQAGQIRAREPGKAPTAQAITVVKIGGSLLADPRQWRTAIAALAAASQPLVVVPGGGPFADAVRGVDAAFTLTDDAAHWMAIAGMDQHAEMIVATGDAFVRVHDAPGIERALHRGLIAVIAPLQWLRAADPLPHSWDITSDSIAAWIASRINATRLVLIKPAGATGPSIVDPGFHRTWGPDRPCTVCDAFQLEAQLAADEPSPR
jgi:probable H4MPT-linked C1 transfer pathway protein